MHKPLTTDQFVLVPTPLGSVYLLLQQKCLLIKITPLHMGATKSNLKTHLIFLFRSNQQGNLVLSTGLIT